MDMKLEELEELEVQAGKTYTRPGATTKARMTSGYCLQPGSYCATCNLVNYGLDCRNNTVERGLDPDDAHFGAVAAEISRAVNGDPVAGADIDIDN